MSFRKKRKKQTPDALDLLRDWQTLMWSRFRQESLNSAVSRRRLRDLIRANFVSHSIPPPCSDRVIIQCISAAAQKPIPIDHLCSELDGIVLSRGRVVFGSPGKYFDEIAQNYPELYWWLSDKGLRMEKFRANKRSPDFDQFAGHLVSQVRSKQGRKYLKQADYRAIAEEIDKAGFSLRENLQGKYPKMLDHWNQKHSDKTIKTFCQAVNAKQPPALRRGVLRRLYRAESKIGDEVLSGFVLY
jgi:hypothetical protein